MKRTHLFLPFYLLTLAAPSAFSTALPLHVEGRLIKDSAGRAIVLRGVNHHGFLDVPDGAWDAPGEPLYSGMGRWRPEVVQGTLDDLAAKGFNVIRLHTVVEWWQKDPDTYQDPYRKVKYPEHYRQMVKDVVDWAGERGLYVIFDFYALRNESGVQSGQETLPWAPWGRFPKVLKDRKAFEKVLQSVAQTLGACPNLILEPYNEPHGDEAAEREWFKFLDEDLPSLRKATRIPILVQWDRTCWVNLDYPPYKYRAATLDWVARHTLFDRNLIYGTHLYRNSGGGEPGMAHRSLNGPVNLWASNDLAKALSLMRFPGSQGGLLAPLVVTEIGADLKAAGEDRVHELLWFKNCLDQLNGLGVGYVGWAWQDDRQLDHGLLHEGQPNVAGKILLDSLRPSKKAPPAAQPAD